MIFLYGWAGCVGVILGAILFTAGFLMRRDQLQQRRIRDLEDDYQRRVYLAQPWMRDAVDEEEEAIERAYHYLKGKRS